MNNLRISDWQCRSLNWNDDREMMTKKIDYRATDLIKDHCRINSRSRTVRFLKNVWWQIIRLSDNDSLRTTIRLIAFGSPSDWQPRSLDKIDDGKIMTNNRIITIGLYFIRTAYVLKKGWINGHQQNHQN